ncbi:MAG TPA: N-acetylmuramic acid 6-phosphate etherase [Candidatus Cybelea sp.]|nr:N-acetylmuramic acid 6-phosphate etherase [Candidatus Cybelea sp.]
MSELAPTERANPRSTGLDRLRSPALVELLVAEQSDAVAAVRAQVEQIAGAVDAIAARLARGGTLHYVGAGSSGRIAMLDAAEMPPTFGTPPALVRAHLAGGGDAMARSVEGAEDDGEAGAAAIRRCVTPDDAVIGISASGGAAFVVHAIEAARSIGAYTLAITSVVGSRLAVAAEAAIVLDTGPEALTGSTRLKAATAQKIALNAISTAVMVRLGKVHDNLMVDLVASNEKLRSRALRLVCELADVTEKRAGELLDAASGRVKVAIVMERRHLDAAQALEQLATNGGSLRELL